MQEAFRGEAQGREPSVACDDGRLDRHTVRGSIDSRSRERMREGSWSEAARVSAVPTTSRRSQGERSITRQRRRVEPTNERDPPALLAPQANHVLVASTSIPRGKISRYDTESCKPGHRRGHRQNTRRNGSGRGTPLERKKTTIVEILHLPQPSTLSQAGENKSPTGSRHGRIPATPVLGKRLCTREFSLERLSHRVGSEVSASRLQPSEVSIRTAGALPCAAATCNGRSDRQGPKDVSASARAPAPSNSWTISALPPA